MRIQLNYINSDIINLTFIKALTGARVKLTSVFSIKVKVNWLNKITIIVTLIIKIFQGTIYLTVCLIVFIKGLGEGPNGFLF